jgi:diadenosine tetraphosphatase ApaH/serine/threonine PP2A family protein phosphatase
MRVFSARHYDKSKGNAAAMLLVGHKKFLGTGDRGLVVRAKVIRPPPFKSKSTRSLHDAAGRSKSEKLLPLCKAAKLSNAQKTCAKDQLAKPPNQGVEVDQECDVVNKSMGGKDGHKFTAAQNWQSEDESSAQTLHADAVVGRVALCGDRFVGPRDRVGQLASALVERVMELVDLVKDESVDVIDQNWHGPPEAKGDLFSWLFSAPGVVKAAQGESPIESLHALCKTAQDILLRYPTLVQLRAPAKIFGDLRGHVRDVLLFFDEFGRPTVGRGGDIEVVSYVFNGGWVDSGTRGLELFTMLVALKVTYPERVWLIRGGHEGEPEGHHPHRTAFDAECERRAGSTNAALKLSQNIFSVFDCLPLAATIEKRVLVVHGGIGDGSWSLEDLEAIKRPLSATDLALNNTAYGILWSVPLRDGADHHTNENEDDDTVDAIPRYSSTDSIWNEIEDSFRGTGGPQRLVSQVSPDDRDRPSFSSRDTEDFCKRNKIGLIVRSHQCVQHGFGYSLMHQGRLMRVFSARNYKGERKNAGAMLLIGYKRPRARGARGIVIRAKVIAPPDPAASPGNGRQGDANDDMAVAASKSDLPSRFSSHYSMLGSSAASLTEIDINAARRMHAAHAKGAAEHADDTDVSPFINSGKKHKGKSLFSRCCACVPCIAHP